MSQKLKRFVVTGWSTYYPSPGLGNVCSSFDTFKEAKEEAAKIWDGPEREYADGKVENVAVYDSENIDRVIFNPDPEWLAEFAHLVPKE